MRSRDFSFLTPSHIKFTAIISVLCVANAKASPITYTETVTASGQTEFHGSYSGDLLTLTGTGDTTTITCNSSGCTNPVTLSWTLSSGGSVVGGGVFAGSSDAKVIFGSDEAGFDNTEATPFFLATTNSAFSTYALSTPINVSGTAVFSPGNCPTTFGGCVEIDSVTGDATFTATPLPAALPLFATGIGGLGLLGWRRRRKAQAI